MKRMGILIAAAFALAACATAETETASDTTRRDCFRPDDVSGYSVIDDHNIGVRVGTRNYILTTSWDARDLDWTQTIALRSRTSWVCAGEGWDLELIGGTPPRHYPISHVARAPNDEQPTGS